MLTPSVVAMWQSAVEAVDKKEFQQAIRLFTSINHLTAKMTYNLSILYFELGDFPAADKKLWECTDRDGYLVVAYFQRGIVVSLLGRLQEGRELLKTALLNMRGADCIDYSQLGLQVSLTQQQVRQNLEAVEEVIRIFGERKQMQLGQFQTLPMSVFRPPHSRVANLDKKDFLSEAKVISSVPEIVMQRGKPKIAQSNSAPVSPSTGHKLPGGLPCPVKLSTPPPSRPPPRLPGHAEASRSVSGAGVTVEGHSTIRGGAAPAVWSARDSHRPDKRWAREGRTRERDAGHRSSVDSGGDEPGRASWTTRPRAAAAGLETPPEHGATGRVEIDLGAEGKRSTAPPRPPPPRAPPSQPSPPRPPPSQPPPPKPGRQIWSSTLH